MTTPNQPNDDADILDGTENDPTRQQPAKPPAAKPGEVAGIPAASSAEMSADELKAGADEQADSDATQSIAEALAEAAAAITGQAVADIRAFAESFAPYIAHFGVLSADPDPMVRARAAAALRSIQRQAIMEAGRLGVIVQQDMEQRFQGAIIAIAAIGKLL
jgi:hypothetical protein